ncbi:hypothetical protein C8J56DRAFT_929882 [Mycena floridula]|nr:hypothetical protein C8J56DRAFT_929882 [Mycena floridula]
MNDVHSHAGYEEQRRPLLRPRSMCRLEDARSFVRQVPMCIRIEDRQLFVPDDLVTETVICANYPYIIIDGNQDHQWKDFFNKDRPYAFQNTPTTLLVHKNPGLASDYAPVRILIHSALSTFHFDILDKSRSCTIQTHQIRMNLRDLSVF